MKITLDLYIKRQETEANKNRYDCTHTLINKRGN